MKRLLAIVAALAALSGCATFPHAQRMRAEAPADLNQAAFEIVSSTGPPILRNAVQLPHGKFATLYGSGGSEVGSFPNAAPLSGSERMLADQNASTVDITPAQIAQYLGIPNGLTFPLSIANGGTGTATPGLIAGTNVTITGSWPNQTINSTGGGGTPGGSSTQVQFNNSGAFGGSANFTWNGTSLGLGASGTLGTLTLGNATSGTVTITPPTGALGTLTLTLPSVSGIFPAITGVITTGDCAKFASATSITDAGACVGGGMTWPAAAGIPCYSGSSTWCTSYSATNPIPSNYLTVPSSLAGSPTDGQFWGYQTSAGQGWYTPTGSGTVDSSLANEIGCYPVTGTAVSGCLNFTWDGTNLTVGSPSGSHAVISAGSISCFQSNGTSTCVPSLQGSEGTSATAGNGKLGVNYGSDWLLHQGMNSVDLGPLPINIPVWSNGGTNAYTLPTVTIPALIKGDKICGDPGITNTSASTLNVNSLGAIAIQKQGGQALQGGELASGHMACVVYNGSVFELVSGNVEPIGIQNTGATLAPVNTLKFGSGLTISDSGGVATVTSGSGVSQNAAFYDNAQSASVTGVGAIPNQEHLYSFNIPVPLSISYMVVSVTTADATGLYSFSLYNSSGTLICSTTPSSYASTGILKVPCSQGSNITVAPGKYAMGWSANASTLQLAEVSSSVIGFFATSTNAGATSGGASLPSITFPAESFSASSSSPWVGIE